MINTNAPTEIHSASEQISDPWTNEVYGQQVFDFAPIGMALTSLDGQLLRANAALCRMMDYTSEELLACKLNDVIYPNDLPHNLVLFKRLRAGEIAHYQIDTRLVHKAGALIFASLYVGLIRDVHGRPRHASIHVVNITEHKRAEEMLRTSEARYRAVVEDQTELICRSLPDGSLTFVNDAYCRYLGETRTDLLGKNLKTLTAESERNVQQRTAALNHETPLVTYEQQVTVGDADIRWLQWSDRAVFDSRGHLIEIQSVGRDITELKCAEQATLQAHKAQSLGVLADGVAHDFNNVLVSILGQISLMQRSLPADSVLRPHLNKAVRAAERAADLAQQMLIYSGRAHFETRPLNLNRLIQDYLVLLRNTASKDIQFRDSLDSHLPLIKADPGQMQRLIVNLLENATEAIDDRRGMLMVTTGVRTIDAHSKPVQLYAGTPLLPGQYVTLRVQDNGSGMDVKTSVKIFDPFFTTKPSRQGLGLAVVLGIVQSYRGGIQVQSQPGKGSVFTLFFPTSPIEPAQSSLATSTPAAIRSAATILVIDDEEMVREALTDILEAEGYYILHAADGASGIALYRKRMEDIGLVLLDLTMPGLSGEQTLDVLKKINPNVRVLISSGCSEQEARLRFKDEPIAGFVKKPYSADVLVSSIWRHLA